MKRVEPIFLADLFPELHSRLIELLSSLSTKEWQKSTICSPWTVKDVAAHLLDGDVRQLSFRRDKMPPPEPDSPITSYGGLVAYLNQINEEWVKAFRRVSPDLLTTFLDLTGQQLYPYYRALDPDEPALFPVAWAGDEISSNWFDIAREYTERWLHQQHIREAVDRPGLTGRRFLYPVLDTFMRALPFTYREVGAVEGARLGISVTGEAGGEWALVREQAAWQLYEGRPAEATASVTLSQDTAWRLFTKGLGPQAAQAQVRIEGDKEIGAVMLQVVSIMG